MRARVCSDVHRLLLFAVWIPSRELCKVVMTWHFVPTWLVACNHNSSMCRALHGPGMRTTGCVPLPIMTNLPILDHRPRSSHSLPHHTPLHPSPSNQSLSRLLNLSRDAEHALEGKLGQRQPLGAALADVGNPSRRSIEDTPARGPVLGRRDLSQVLRRRQLEVQWHSELCYSAL